MTKDELLKPRYKVIADYPGSHFKEGNILLQFKGRYEFWSTTDINPMDEIYHPEEYPHLFKRLEWWEERTTKELPAFVSDRKGKTVKVFEWHKMANETFFLLNPYIDIYKEDWYNPDYFDPSDESLYHLYQQTK